MITADTITDEQIRDLWKRGLISHDSGDALRTKAAREKLDEAAIAAANANPDGLQIEHLNHAVLDAAHELGRSLLARARCAAILNTRSSK